MWPVEVTGFTGCLSETLAQKLLTIQEHAQGRKSSR
jgi:hypothetical protein